jgi:hypothetical protein
MSFTSLRHSTVRATLVEPIVNDDDENQLRLVNQFFSSMLFFRRYHHGEVWRVRRFALPSARSELLESTTSKGSIILNVRPLAHSLQLFAHLG